LRRILATAQPAPYRYAREGGMVKTEDDPLDPTPPPNTRETSSAMTYLENAVTNLGGIALRYGGFYGAANDALTEPVRKRQLPIVGDGAGIFPWSVTFTNRVPSCSPLGSSEPRYWRIACSSSEIVALTVPFVAVQ